MTEENISILLLPSLSESIPAGRLKTTPVNADTADTKPTPEGSAPKCDANRGSTGLLDMVELNMAKSPVAQSSRKGFDLTSLSIPL